MVQNIIYQINQVELLLKCYVTYQRSVTIITINYIFNLLKLYTELAFALTFSIDIALIHCI